MSVPSFSFKHQKTPSTRSVKLAGVTVSRDPVIIDYSSTYANNQESAISVDSYTNSGGTVNISGVVGNFLITDLLMDDGTFVFYEYQTKFDANTSGIQVVDTDGIAIPYKAQYAYIETSGGQPDVEFPLSSLTALDYDLLTGYSEIGTPSGTFTFAPVAGPSGALGYSTHSDSLADNVFNFPQFNKTNLPASGTLDFTFYAEDDSKLAPTIFAGDWSIGIGSGIVDLTVDGTTSSQIAINDNTWYRGRMVYSEDFTRVEVYRTSLEDSQQLTQTIDPSGLDISCNNIFINHLALFSTAPAVDWRTPPVVPRYHHALRWADSPLTDAAPYRMRILTEENVEGTITYDAYKAGVITPNVREKINYNPIYEETIAVTNEWSTSGNSLLLNGPISNSSLIYLKSLFSGLISVQVIDKHVVVTDGSFRSDPFVEADGKYTYELLEYANLMPFETDSQNNVVPKSLKESHVDATIVSAYKIKVLPMVVFEGRYPDYDPPETVDIIKTVADGAVTSSTGDISNNTWRNTRGIKIYVNGTLRPQTDIAGFDAAKGIIELNTSVNLDDDVKVTYLREVKYFICNYPRLKPELHDGTSWRIYLRPNYPNHFIANPTDTLERLTYKKLVNGQPTGTMKSCVSNATVTEFDGTIQLADISLTPIFTITDTRIFGGGLLPDSELGGEAIRIADYPSSIFYSDIANYQSSAPADISALLPWPALFIRIPAAVKSRIESRFTNASAALDYIKKTIEKRLALGVYYIIIDENNKPWDNPYPSTSPKGVGNVDIEL